MGTDQNGDESGKRMVSGGNALLWRFGICAGEDTRINRSMIHFGRCRTEIHRISCTPLAQCIQRIVPKGTVFFMYQSMIDGGFVLENIVISIIHGQSRIIWRKENYMPTGYQLAPMGL